ncbi:LacI family DNA-binding transcriptional regulator [Kribbella sp. DT2]|uniref:LacI family DNA-binding transcriptional regulator n=1 Tax=Kribbella sp. DT2 TaxID=3393427 RepID=UPI003CF9D899
MVDVARRARVSVTTVSHVLNDTRFVAPETREAVLAAVRETGYVPNTVARSLVMSKTDTIGLALSSISNPYFGELAHHLQAEAERRGYSILIADTHDDPDREQLVVRDLHERRADGIIIAVSARPDATLDYLRQRNVPVVLVDRMIGSELDEVGTENVEATARLVEHLTGLGHTRIGIVAGLPGVATSEERIVGYRLGLERAGLAYAAELRTDGASDAVPAQGATARLLALDDPPTALIVANNQMTIGAMRALRQAGVSVPGDLALVAFDDFEWADLFEPRLTTIAQPHAELATRALELITSRIAEPELPARSIRVEPRLVHRNSCGCQTT